MWGEFGWILEDNKGMLSIAELPGARVNHRYRIYEKALEFNSTQVGAKLSAAFSSARAHLSTPAPSRRSAASWRAQQMV